MATRAAAAAVAAAGRAASRGAPRWRDGAAPGMRYLTAPLYRPVPFGGGGGGVGVWTQAWRHRRCYSVHHRHRSTVAPGAVRGEKSADEEPSDRELDAKLAGLALPALATLAADPLLSAVDRSVTESVYRIVY